MPYTITKTLKKDMKTLLQKMYDDANWYGYATRKGKKYYGYKISQIAKRLGVNLEYNCPA